MQVCEPSAGSMLICVSVVVVPWVFGLTPASPTIDHAYESPFCGSGFAQVNCTLPPSAEYDPVTYEPLAEMVPVSAVGTVVSWTWQPEPLEGQPLDRPFAWALIKLDGADTPLLHAVDAPAALAVDRRNTRLQRECQPVRYPQPDDVD